MANIKNLANGIVLTAPSPATSGTSIVLESGQGAYMPVAPFYATVTPQGSLSNPATSEIISVTNVSTDTLTIVRAQMGTMAQSIAVGWFLGNGVYTTDLITTPSSTAGGRIAIFASSTGKELTQDSSFYLDGSTHLNVKGIVVNDGATATTLDMTTNKIIDLGTPTTSTDAANKQYVDDNIAAVSLADLDDVEIFSTPVDGQFLRWATTNWAPQDLNAYEIGALESSQNLSDLANAVTARANLGIGSIDDTSDLDKPVSTAQQTALDLKADLASPTFTGTPSAPTPSANDNSTKISTTAYVDAKAGTQSLVRNEVPGGTINGSNTAFTTASSFATGTLRVYKNGIRLKGGGADYTAGASSFTMVTAPATGTVLLADYEVGSSAFSVGTNSTIKGEVPTGTVNGATVIFTASRAYIAGSLQVFVNGLNQARTTHFTETTPSTGVFTMSDAPLTGDIITINYDFNLNPSSNADTVDGMHGSEVAPVGSITMFGGSSAPSGWLICDGSSLLRASYAALFTVIGVVYGSADGTHFTLPDLRGRVGLGVGDSTATGHTAHTLGQVGGEETHTMTTGELVAHTHTTKGKNTTAGAATTLFVTGNTETQTVDAATSSTGSGTPFNELPPYVGLNYIIKSQ